MPYPPSEEKTAHRVKGRQLAIVTGASGGLGSELCRQLAKRQVNILLVDRSVEKSKALANELDGLLPDCVQGTFAVDLADRADIQRLASELVARFPAIDYLFNNAGVLTETLQFSKYGNELHFEVNTLAPLQLIDLLRPALSRSQVRMIVNTSAGLSLKAKTLNWDELLRPKTFQKLYGPYVNSKQALNVVTAALASELGAEQIVVRAADPGPNKTRLTKGKGTPLWMRMFYWALPGPQKGAGRLLSAAVSEKWDRQSGVFISGGKIRPLPAALASSSFQREFLAKCRKLIENG